MLEDKSKPTFVTCTHCGKTLPFILYYITNSPFFKNGLIPICPDCLSTLPNYDWQNENDFDKFCRYADWPFDIRYYKQLKLTVKDSAILDSYYKTYIVDSPPNYAYDKYLNWDSANRVWAEYAEKNKLHELLPEQLKAEEEELRDFWEPDKDRRYTLDELRYLDKLYHDTERTQNITTGAQIDQAKKLARLSLDMDKAQKCGELDLYARLMKAYVDLIRIAEFTPKSSTSSATFESIGELIMFLEKTGFINKFYDGEERDIVDKTIKNQQMFLRRIVAGDSTLSERIEQRLERMKALDRLEDGLTPSEEWSYDLEDDDTPNSAMPIDPSEYEDFKEDL